MIRKEKDYFILDTDHTTYCFRVLPTGQLEHLYYGRKLHIEDEADMQPLVEKHVFAPGNVNLYNEEQKAYSLEDMRLEMSSYGKGDISGTAGFLWQRRGSGAALCPPCGRRK